MFPPPVEAFYCFDEVRVDRSRSMSLPMGQRLSLGRCVKLSAKKLKLTRARMLTDLEQTGIEHSVEGYFDTCSRTRRKNEHRDLRELAKMFTDLELQFGHRVYSPNSSPFALNL